MKNTHRRVIVLSSLVTVLSLTSALLLALAPAPLRPDATSSLFAVDSSQTMDTVFQTENPIRSGRWKYIYVHQSRTLGGNAQTLGSGDHFVIGNGDGCTDGEIQLVQRWNQQQASTPPAGAQMSEPESIISICLIGDFDRSVPTPAQLQRLSQLVTTLQGRLHIRGRNVVLLDQTGSSASTGRYFPASGFREQILP